MTAICIICQKAGKVYQRSVRVGYVVLALAVGYDLDRQGTVGWL